MLAFAGGYASGYSIKDDSIKAAGAALRPVRCSSLTLGVHIDLAYEGSAARRANIVAATQRILRGRIARNTLLWDRIEGERGVRDWSVTDAVVDELAGAGIEPLFVVMGSPSWANGVPPSVDLHQLYVPTRGAAFARWLRLLGSFAHDAALRYRGKVKRWEIWNEPNLSTFWRPQPNPTQYRETYRTIRNAIVTAEPDAKVAIGGLAVLRVAWGNGNVAGLEFLDDLLRRGTAPSFVAIHTYTTPPHSPAADVAGQNNFSDVGRVHALLRNYGVRASIWVTEWGWSSRSLGTDRQAAYVAQSLKILRDRYPFVTVATYFIDHDRPPRFYEGLLDASLQPKPAAARFAAFATSLKRCRSASQRPVTEVVRT